MAKNKNIENTHKGEPVEILFQAKNGDGTVITDPANQTVIVTIGRTPKGEPILRFDQSPQIILLSVSDGEWFIQLAESALAGLVEEKTYHYNIWTRAAGGEPRLQAFGRLKRLPAVGP